MKTKILVATLLCLIFTSCAPASIPLTATNTPAKVSTTTPTVTMVPALPTSTSTPTEWSSSIEQLPIGLWIIKDVTFYRDRIVALETDANGGNDPRFGAEGEGELHLRCYGEVELKTGATALIGLEWWSKNEHPEPGGGNQWLGFDYITGYDYVGASETSHGALVYENTYTCLDFFEANYFKGNSAIKIRLESYSGNDIGALASILSHAATLDKAWDVLMPPAEFWADGDVSLLPKVFDKPFLLVSSLSVQR